MISTRRTHQLKKRYRSRVHDFMKCIATADGRKVLVRRRKKGRKVLSTQAAEAQWFF